MPKSRDRLTSAAQVRAHQGNFRGAHKVNTVLVAHRFQLESYRPGVDSAAQVGRATRLLWLSASTSVRYRQVWQAEMER